MIKYSVGYQLHELDEESFAEMVDIYQKSISEVFFSWPEIASGRGDIASNRDTTAQEIQKRMVKELKEIKKMGIKLDLLFNANCYGAESLSEKPILTYVFVSFAAADNCSNSISPSTTEALQYLIQSSLPDSVRFPILKPKFIPIG